MLGKNYKVYTLLIGMCLIGFSTYAQDIELDEDGEIETGEIVIEKDRKIVLPQSRKIYQKIKSPEVNVETSKVANDFKNFNYNPEVKLPTLRPAMPELNGKKDEVYDHYFKVGYGNFSSPLLQADLNLLTDKTKTIRANLDHLSFGKGAKDGKNSASSYTSVGVNGSVVGDGATVSAGINYTTTTDHFYGYQDGLTINQSDIRHKYNYFQALIGIEDNNEKNDIDYGLSVDFTTMKDNLSAKENGVTLGAGMNYGKQFFIDSEFIFSKYTQSSFNQNRGFIRVNPFYRFETAGVKIDAGFSFSSISGGLETFGSSTIFPFVRANYQASQNIKLFAQLDGGMTFNSYEDYARVNAYLRDDLVVQNSRVNYDFRLGAAIKPAQNVSINPYFGLKSIRNLGMFLNTLPDTTSFVISYIQGNTKIVDVGTELKASMGQNNEIGLNFAILSYSSKAQDNFYHLPTSKIELLGTHKFLDKLMATWSFNLLGGIKGQQSNGLTEGTESTSNLSAITELNLNLDYQINERTGAFLQFNNILGKNYERYLNYPMRGLQIKGGVSFRF